MEQDMEEHHKEVSITEIKRGEWIVAAILP